MKVVTLMGTRPDIIKLSRVINKLDAFFNHTIVHTGQNFDFELNSIFFNQLEIRKPDFFLEASDQTPAKTIANVLQKFDETLSLIQPDAVLVLGDTNSALGIIAAKRRKIPIFHMEAGNRSFDQRVPEEINRKIVDHLSDINLPYTQIAKQHLLFENFPIDRIIVTGSPMKEVLNYYMPKSEDSKILDSLGLKSESYFLVSSHREENVDVKDNLIAILSALSDLYDKFKLPIIFSTHPRTRKRIDELGFSINPNIRFEKPFGFIDYLKLQINAKCVISDSGTITEEASILNFPAVNLRTAHERPEGMEQMSVILSGLNKIAVMKSVELAISLKPHLGIIKVPDYETDDVSSKIVGLIQSYTHYVNRNVWGKN